MPPRLVPSSRPRGLGVARAAALCVALFVAGGCHQEANRTAKQVYPTVPDIFAVSIGLPSIP